MTKHEQALENLMHRKDAKKEIIFDVTIITYYNDVRNMCACAVFTGKRIKPNWHFLFRSEVDRSKWIDETKKDAIKSHERRTELEKEWELEKVKFVSGVILYSSWGYDQTNIDFYQILDRRGCMVTLQEIGQDRETTGFMSGDCTPDPAQKIGKPFRKRISKYGTINLTSFSSAWIWDGRKKGWSSYA